MNKYGLIALSGVMALAAASCDDQLDITPKGQTTLSNVNDLETLLNQRFTIFTNPTEMEVLCGIQLTGYPTIGQQLTETNSFNYALLKGDRKSVV